MGWKVDLLANLELCRPDLLESMKKNGTLEQYLESREDQAIEMFKRLKKDGLHDDQAEELVIDSLFLREIDEPEDDEDDLKESQAGIEGTPPLSAEDSLREFLKSQPVGTKFEFRVPKVKVGEVARKPPLARRTTSE